MFSKMQVTVHNNEYEVISYMSRPMSFTWNLGRMQWRNKQKHEQNETKPFRSQIQKR